MSVTLFIALVCEDRSNFINIIVMEEDDVYANATQEELEEIFNDLVADSILMTWEVEHDESYF